MARPDDQGRRAPPPGEGGARKPFLLRLSPEVLEELRVWASNDFRSLNAHIEYLLRQAIKRRRGEEDV